MSNHKTIKKELLITLAIGLAMLIAFNVAVSYALTVEPLPAQPELTVKPGESIRYKDGSIDLQPASKQAGSQLQNTINARDLQGN